MRRKRGTFGPTRGTTSEPIKPGRIKANGRTKVPPPERSARSATRCCSPVCSVTRDAFALRNYLRRRRLPRNRVIIYRPRRAASLLLISTILRCPSSNARLDVIGDFPRDRCPLLRLGTRQLHLPRSRVMYCVSVGYYTFGKWWKRSFLRGYFRIYFIMPRG